MKVLVTGAAGKTGAAVVESALRAGHQVTALVHHAEEGDLPGIAVLQGDAADAAVVERAVRGQDAVIDTIGGKTPYKTSTSLEADAAKALVAGMQRVGVRRLVVTSMVGEGDSRESTTALERLLLSTFLRGATADKARMEAEVDESGLDWVIVRPAILGDGPATADVRVIDPASREKAKRITRADLADFLVGQLTSDDHLGTAVTVANR